MPAITTRAISSRQSASGSNEIPVELVIAGSLCLFVSIVSVCARLFTKMVDLRRMQADDCEYWASQHLQMHTDKFRDLIAGVGVC